jgi:hypothetical protein
MCFLILIHCNVIYNYFYEYSYFAVNIYKPLLLSYSVSKAQISNDNKDRSDLLCMIYYRKEKTCGGP